MFTRLTLFDVYFVMVNQDHQKSGMTTKICEVVVLWSPEKLVSTHEYPSLYEIEAKEVTCGICSTTGIQSRPLLDVP